MMTNAFGRPGQVLVLTKPLGTGVLATALKAGALPAEGMAEAAASMATLNAQAAAAARAAAVRTATDITGFGLVGHALHVARESRLTLEIRARELPLLSGALDHARPTRREGSRPTGGSSKPRWAGVTASRRRSRPCSSIPRPRAASSSSWTKRRWPGCWPPCPTPASVGRYARAGPVPHPGGLSRLRTRWRIPGPPVSLTGLRAPRDTLSVFVKGPHSTRDVGRKLMTPNALDVSA